MGLLEKCITSLEAEANKLEGRAVLSAAPDTDRTAPQAKDARDAAADTAQQPLPVETDATADLAAKGATTVDSRTGHKEFEKLRHNSGGKVLVTDYIDRRKSERTSDRRQNKRQVEGLNTLNSIDLRKNFGAKEIVRGVGFSIKGGDVAGLLGPNGAGKTTIFYMIVGFYKPTTGDIKLNNVSIIHGPMYQRARMGIAYLPQEASIFRKLTVEQNIWAILESRKDINKKQKKEKLNILITEFGIERIRKQYGYTLSGGERRRTEIARALAIDPKFLLLDEPFAGIDPMAVSEIKQIIKRLAENGIGILITDHNVRDTLEITSAAFIINRGSIVARGTRDHILENKIVRDVYLGSDFKMLFLGLTIGQPGAVTKVSGRKNGLGIPTESPSRIYSFRATLINFDANPRCRATKGCLYLLISLRKCVNSVDIHIKVAPVYAHSHKSVLP